jgi:two-component system chemotaxis response regulator CheY
MASKTILVIDADSETEQLIASTLESEGYLVFAVPGGDVGTEMAQKVSPSLIFINPDETGLEICKTIHEFESLQKVPIILLTSPSSGIDLRDVASFGVADFLDVPCTPDQLLKKTVKVLATKAPIVLHVKEKERVPEKEESGPPDFLNAPAAQQGKGARLEAPEMSGIEELDEERESTGGPTREIAPDFSYGTPPKEGTPRRKKKSNSPVVAAGLVIVIAGIAGFLFYSGLIPGLGTKKSVPVKPVSSAAKPKAEAPVPAPSPSPAQSPAPSNEQQKQQPVIESKAVPSPPAPAQKAAPSIAVKKELAPMPAPAASPGKPSSKTAGKKTYSVQLGVFRSESNAAALAEQFKAKGYDAFMIKGAGKDSGTLYRVLIGKSEDRKESVKLAARLKDEEKIKAVIYTE